MKNYGLRSIGMFFIFIAVFAGACAVVMLLWNELIPAIIGWSAISYWQAAGLIVLSRLLFGGFGGFGHAGHFFHRGRESHMDHFMQARESMKGMSLDQRREFIRNHMAGFTRATGNGDNENKESHE